LIARENKRKENKLLHEEIFLGSAFNISRSFNVFRGPLSPPNAER
jgi:hypothetical protein